MEAYVYILKLALILPFFLDSTVVAWWPFQGAKVQAPLTKVKSENGETGGEYLRNSPVPFEMSVAEQKFLAEAQRYMGDMSALDQCHQVIITRLRKSCHEIGEEEIGKLAVDLFNCQSKAEGRTLYYCSEEMSLRDCTSEMDPDAWNAYHIISNRARSVCYATRNQQFRMKTEYLVNKLAHTANDQMDFLEQLKTGQENLKEATKGTMAKLSAGHRNLIQEQSRIRGDFSVVNKELTNKMNENMLALHHEKRIIQEAEKQVSSMTNVIASTLASTTDELKKQDEKRIEEHAAVLSDLEEIKTKSLDTWEKIDEKTSSIREHQEQSLDHHVDIIQNLDKLNDTIGFILKSLEEFETRFDIRLSWLADQFGGTGDKVAILTICFLHFLYFIFMVICVLFLNAPATCRVAILIMVPFNAWAAIKLETGMSYVTMTVLIMAITAGNYVVEVTRQNMLKAEEKSKEHLLRPIPIKYIENIGLPESGEASTPTHSKGNCSFFNSNYQASPIPKSAIIPDINRSSTPKPGSRPITPNITITETLRPAEVENAKRQLDLTANTLSAESSTMTRTPSKHSLADRSSRRCGAQTKVGSACKRRISKMHIACDCHR